MRAASSAWIVGGTTTASSPASSSIATISSTKSGLPSALARIRRRRLSSRAGASLSRSVPASPAGKRLEQEGARVQLSPAPPGPDVEKLRPAEAEDEERRAPAPVRNVLDQVEQRGLSPVDVLPEDDQRPVRRVRLEQLARGVGDLVDGAFQEALEIRVSEPAENLDERPVGDPLAVGKAAADDDARVGGADELLRQSCLADARRAEQREEVARALRRRDRVRLAEQAQLTLSPDERQVEAPSERVLAGADRDEPEGRHGLRLPLQRERLDRFDRDRVAHEPHRLGAEQCLAGRSRLLEPRRDVDRIARRQPLARSRDDLARVDAYPDSNPELVDRGEHLRGGPDGAQRVVLVQERHAEDRHHGIADELLDRPAVPLDDPFHAFEVAGEEIPQQLRVGPLPERRRADDVAEDHGHDLALLALRLGRRDRRTA